MAHRLLEEQRERFDGVRKAAYTAAGVNPATWTRVVGGQRVRPDRLVKIVKSLWPESSGRWEAIPNPRDGGSWSGVVPDYVAQGEWTSEIENSMADVDGRFIALEARVRDLEYLLAEMTEDTDDENQNEEEGGDDGTQTSTQKTDGPDDGDLGGVTSLRPRRPSGPPNADELSEPDETVPAAADRFKGEGDEPPGGSR